MAFSATPVPGVGPTPPCSSPIRLIRLLHSDLPASDRSGLSPRRSGLPLLANRKSESPGKPILPECAASASATCDSRHSSSRQAWQPWQRALNASCATLLSVQQCIRNLLLIVSRQRFVTRQAHRPYGPARAVVGSLE